MPFHSAYISKGVIAVSSKLTERGCKSPDDTIQTCSTSNLKLPFLKTHEFRLVTLFFPMSDLFNIDRSNIIILKL